MKSERPVNASSSDTVAISTTVALAMDEDRWYRQESASLLAVPHHEWLVQCTAGSSNSGSPLADEEDAWART